MAEVSLSHSSFQRETKLQTLFTKGQTGLHIDFQFKTFPIRPHCPWRISNCLTWGLGGNSRKVSKDTANSPISSKIHKLLTPWFPALPVHHSHLGSFHKSSQWCHPAISSSVIPFSSCPQPSQHQSLLQWVTSLYEVAKVLEFQL